MACVSRCRSATTQAFADLLQRPGPGRERRRLREEVLGQAAHIHRVEVEEVRLLRLREHQEVAHDRFIRSSSSSTSAIVRRRSSGILFQHLEMSPDDGDRRAQLVAGIVDELPLGAERLLETVEHLVERRCQPRDLVVALDLDPPSELGGRDRRGGVRDVRHGPEDPLGHAPGEQGADQHGRDPHAGGTPQGGGDVGELLSPEDRRNEDPRTSPSALSGTARYSTSPAGVETRPRSVSVTEPNRAIDRCSAPGDRRVVPRWS